MEVDDAVIGSMPVVAVADDLEIWDLAMPVVDALYEVYGRDLCTNLSVIP